MIYLLIAVVAFHFCRSYVQFIRSEPAENLSPVLPLIDREVADTIWVDQCSEAQVRSLPVALPVTEVIIAEGAQVPDQGKKMWVLWTHQGEARCVRSLDQIRARARVWQLVHEGPGRGLALAEF